MNARIATWNSLSRGACVALVVCAGVASAQSFDTSFRSRLAGAISESSAPCLFTGEVRDSGGDAVAGAVVVTSAGGQAVTDARGRYQIAIRPPAGTTSVHVTAVGTATGAASTIVSVPAAGATTSAGVLILQQTAGCQPDWLPTFGGSSTPHGFVAALAVFDDGLGGGPALYAGGGFDAVGGHPVGRVAKWDGTTWTALGSGVESTSTAVSAGVSALAVFDDGSGPALFAGGSFDRAGGLPASCIAKWNGSAWQSLLGGVSGTLGGLGPSVGALHVFDDGSGPALYVAGSFATASGITAPGIVRWNGSGWAAVGSGMDASVYTLCHFDDGSGPALYAGGAFTLAGSFAALHIARWNGSVWSPVAAGFDDEVYALAAYTGSVGGAALYAGGAFRHSGAASLSAIARWNGVQWFSVGSGMNLGMIIPPPYPTVESLAVFDDGSGSGPLLYVSGFFLGAGVLPAQRFAIWNGQTWSAPAGMGNVFPAMVGFDDGSGAGPQLYVGTFNGMAIWNGSQFTSLGTSQIAGRIDSMIVFDEGLGGGPMLIASGGTPGAIARWNGTTWTALGAGLGGQAWAMCVFDDGLGGGPALYAAGNFLFAGGPGANRIAKWNGTAWFALGTGLNDFTRALAVFDDGNGPALYAGGNFTIAGGVGASHVARWNGVAWSVLGTGTNNPVRALIVHDEGSGPRLFAGGEFVTAGGVMARFIARWDGSAWSAVGAGMNNYVSALESFDDGSGPALYAGGVFTVAGTVGANRVAKWNGAWSALGTGVNNEVEALAAFDDGTGPALYAAGQFTTASGVPAERIAKWDGASWTPLGAGLPDSVHVIESIDTGSGATLHAGGDFAYSQAGDSLIARFGCAAQAGAAFCFGDGSGTACPCGNVGATGHGCANSIVAGGALLGAIGNAAIANDTLVLQGSGMPDSSVLYFQGTTQVNGGAGLVFGDGLRCAGGTIVRLGREMNSGGASAYPSAGEMPVSVRGTNSAGASRTYQAWYRNAAAFCSSSTFNLSNGVALTWTP